MAPPLVPGLAFAENNSVEKFVSVLFFIFAAACLASAIKQTYNWYRLPDSKKNKELIKFHLQQAGYSAAGFLLCIIVGILLWT